ncbi:MAG: pilus assembly protein PilM [Deltaproteobacteria bacterium]|nr:pilus assembly protein PilM [Deltaproteobacteria bacterium]
MAQKIAGLDIGDSAVKTVLVTRSITGRSRVIAADVVPVGEGEALKDVLHRLFEKDIYHDAACAAALPAKALSYRNIKLPFRDKKKIDQTLVYELEPTIQTPVDEMYFDYIRSDGEGGSDIFVAACEKAFVDERLGLLAGLAKNLPVIDVDAAACALRAPVRDASPGTFILLDVGMKNTVAVFMGHGKILQMRYFGFGGDFITDKGARFMTELKNTVDYMIWQGVLEQMPSRIYLTGGGVLCDGIEDGLSGTFSIPIEKLDILQAEAIPIDEAVKKGWQPAVMNQALALATRSDASGAGFNFKRRITAGMRRYDEIKKDLRWISAAVLMIAGIGIADLYLDYRFSKSKLDEMKKEVIAEFKKHSPETTRIVEPVSQLKAGIAEARQVTAGIASGHSDTLVLDILRDVSGLAPASADFLIRSLNVESGGVMIKAETASFDSVEAIKKELAKSKHFQSVTVGATNQMKQGDRVEFELRIEIRS